MQFLLPVKWIITSASVALCSIGLFILVLDKNMMRKLIGLSIFQSGIILFFINVSNIPKGHIPIFTKNLPANAYTDPLPHVLMLTAIVVGVASLAVGLALIIRIQESKSP